MPDSVLKLSAGRRAWMVFFTGLPMAVFKIGGGVAAGHDIHWAIGAAFVAWGALDGFLNLAVLFPSFPVSFCTLSNIGRLLDRRWPKGNHEQLFLGVDTLATFLIVSTMIWYGRVGALPEPFPRVWSLCVIANILGVGVDRIWQARRDRHGAGEVTRSNNA